METGREGGLKHLSVPPPLFRRSGVGHRSRTPLQLDVDSVGSPGSRSISVALLLERQICNSYASNHNAMQGFQAPGLSPPSR